MQDHLLTNRKPYTFDRVTRIVIAVSVTVAVVLLIRRLSDVLLPFFAAWLIAYIIEPVVQLNRKTLHLKNRALPVMLTLLEIILTIGTICILFAPSLSDEMHQLDSIIQAYTSDPNHTQLIPASMQNFIDEHLDMRSLFSHVIGQDWKSLLDTIMALLSDGFSLVMWFVSWFVMIIYLVFIMLGYDKLLESFQELVPKKYRNRVTTICDHVADGIGHYFRTQSIIASLVGLLFCVGFIIIGLPLAVAMGLFIGLLNMVPYLQLISIPITTLLCLISSMQTGLPFWPMWWKLILVYCVVQSIQDLLLTPKIMGKAMNLNPAIMFLSLSIWGALMGFVGLIIALPLTSLLLAMYKEYIIRHDEEDSPSAIEAKEEAIDNITQEEDYE